MEFIVDTNVIVVANQDAPQASPACVLTCVRELREIERQHLLVLDQGRQILDEYKRYLRRSGQERAGDRFIRWVLRNFWNLDRCVLVSITTLPNTEDGNDFAEFPQDAALTTFDRSDRKFVAVALAHPEKPPILNATDTDWWIQRTVLEKYGIQIQFLCPDAMGV